VKTQLATRMTYNLIMQIVICSSGLSATWFASGESRDACIAV